VNDLFTKLKRLFEPRPRPAESAGEATADRPPPRVVEAPPVEAAPTREPLSLHEDDLAEVRAALEAVAEAPVEIAEPEAEAPVSADAEAEAPVITDEPEAEAPVTLDEPESVPFPPPTLLPPAAEETVDVPAPEGGRVGDALLLTLGTPPTTFTVTKTSATLGRGQENTIRLDDLSVSRRHARIAYRQGGYWLSDLGSMGGTWVDGTRLNAPRRIAFGDVIDIGLCRLTVSFTGTTAKAEIRKSASKPQETPAQVRRRR
jgi:pSer/pThr/pTyr-binding forkhead associated (FHA) protein